MHPILLKHFNQIKTLTAEEIEAIDATMQLNQFKKGTVLIQEGDVQHQAYFVIEGVVRQYYIVDGEEKTSAFFTDGQWVLSPNNLQPNMPSQHFLECSTNCSLATGDSRKGEELYLKYPNLGTVSRKLMESVYLEQHDKLKDFISNSPTERYLNMLKQHPDIFQKVPQYQIASYIGVTPESLSRIRKRITR
jgi:CRP-like cAMP-binding protein